MKRVDRILQTLRVRQVAPYIAPGASVLDVGCADGALLRHVSCLGRYVGVDPDAPLVTVDSRARFIRGTFPTAELAAEDKFDVMTLLAVLEHVPVAAQPAFAQACARQVVPNGRLAITVPSPLVDPILDVLMRLAFLDGMETDQHYGFDPKHTPAVFEPFGFRLERHHRFELGLNHLFVFRRTAT